MIGDRTSDYEFDLPPDRIAQEPAARRDESRLMVVDRASGAITHHRFSALATMIPPGDALVINTSRVLRARLIGTRETGAPAEVFLLHPLGEGYDRWEALVHPGGKLHPGRVVRVAPELTVRIDAVTERRTREVTLVSPLPVRDAIERFGHVPLPPYIKRADAPADAEPYQTVYARELGSVAAPTAGLHFTPELLATLAARGVRRAEVVLHIGAGTFKPVEADDPAEHVMHEESFELSADAAAILNETRAAGRHIWAVGTTTVRTLESVLRAAGTFTACRGETRLFIRPPTTIRAVDKLLTNFHLPRSTLLMLVAAFAGYELTMHAYRTALAEGYRFYSYGDAMLIL